MAQHSGNNERPKCGFCGTSDHNIIVACNSERCLQDYIHLSCAGEKICPKVDELWYCEECKLDGIGENVPNDRNEGDERPGDRSTDALRRTDIIGLGTGSVVRGAMRRVPLLSLQSCIRGEDLVTFPEAVRVKSALRGPSQQPQASTPATQGEQDVDKNQDMVLVLGIASMTVSDYLRYFPEQRKRVSQHMLDISDEQELSLGSVAAAPGWLLAQHRGVYMSTAYQALLDLTESPTPDWDAIALLLEKETGRSYSATAWSGRYQRLLQRLNEDVLSATRVQKSHRVVIATATELPESEQREVLSSLEYEVTAFKEANASTSWDDLARQLNQDDCWYPPRTWSDIYRVALRKLQAHVDIRRRSYSLKNVQMLHLYASYRPPLEPSRISEADQDALIAQYGELILHLGNRRISLHDYLQVMPGHREVAAQFVNAADPFPRQWLTSQDSIGLQALGERISRLFPSSYLQNQAGLRQYDAVLASRWSAPQQAIFHYRHTAGLDFKTITGIMNHNMPRSGGYTVAACRSIFSDAVLTYNSWSSALCFSELRALESLAAERRRQLQEDGHAMTSEAAPHYDEMPEAILRETATARKAVPRNGNRYRDVLLSLQELDANLGIEPHRSQVLSVCCSDDLPDIATLEQLAVRNAELLQRHSYQPTTEVVQMATAQLQGEPEACHQLEQLFLNFIPHSISATLRRDPTGSKVRLPSRHAQSWALRYLAAREGVRAFS